jgi:hypothetical protein
MIDWMDPATVEHLEGLALEDPGLGALLDQELAARRDLRATVLRDMAVRGRQVVLDDLSMSRRWLREYLERLTA